MWKQNRVSLEGALSAPAKPSFIPLLYSSNCIRIIFQPTGGEKESRDYDAEKMKFLLILSIPAGASGVVPTLAWK